MRIYIDLLGLCTSLMIVWLYNGDISAVMLINYSMSSIICDIYKYIYIYVYIYTYINPGNSCDIAIEDGPKKQFM